MSAVQGILSSRGVNRWLPWFAGLVLAAGVITFLVTHYSNTAESQETPISNKPAVVPKTEKSAPLPAVAKSVAARFIDAGVRRQNAVVAYQLSGPDIRQGQTLAEWKRDWNNPNLGVPIVPYPAAPNAALNVEYSYVNSALVDFALTPKDGAKVKNQLFKMELIRIGAPGHKHWVVNAWYPWEPPRIPVQP
jgi:hypothetical protein